MSISLTPGQACYIHGWFHAKDSLTWNDIVQNPNITLGSLLDAKITLPQMHFLQGDLKKWTEHRKISKSEIHHTIGLWETDFIETFKLDIGDICSLRFCPDQLLQMSIDFHRLQEMGLTGENMSLFRHITLKGWYDLGMTRSAAQDYSDAQLYRCFKMRKIDVLNSLKS